MKKAKTVEDIIAENPKLKKKLNKFLEKWGKHDNISLLLQTYINIGLPKGGHLNNFIEHLSYRDPKIETLPTIEDYNKWCDNWVEGGISELKSIYLYSRQEYGSLENFRNNLTHNYYIYGKDFYLQH